jgi:hypothetical protein
MSEKKYCVYDPDDYDFNFFETYEDAKKFLLGNCGHDISEEGFSENFINGKYLIFEVKAKSGFEILHNRDEFCQCDSNTECSCDLDEWPCSDEVESIGFPKLLESLRINEDGK